MWVFADSHARAYRPLRVGYEAQGVMRRLEVDLRNVLGARHAEFDARTNEIDRESRAKRVGSNGQRTTMIRYSEG